MAKKTTAKEALHIMLLAMLEPHSMRTRTRIIRRLHEFEAAIQEQGLLDPHDVVEVLSGFSLSRTLGD